MEDHGVMDGDLIAVLKHERGVDVSVPLRSNRVAFDEGVRWAPLAENGQPHPSRATQQIACVPGVEHVWQRCAVPLHACVMR